jgi:hypothetical protein
MSTAVWLSTAVVNISLPVAGMVELRMMIFDTTPPHCLDAKRQRGHVEQQHLAVAGDEDVGLYAGAQRHHFIRIQLAVRAAAEQFFDLAAHERYSRRAADQDDLVDLRRLEASIGERLTARAEGAFDDRRNQRLELGA